MRSRLILGGIEISIERKPIKNTHLSVYPPNGRVLIAAPLTASEESLRFFAIKELPWIRKQQARLRGHPREPRRDFVERESHMVWGRRYLLHLVTASRARIVMSGRSLHLEAPVGMSQAEREHVMQEWHRARLRERAAPLVEKWARHLGVVVDRFYLQRMRTKWGSSNPARRTIRLNLELAKFTPDCLDYVILHEIAHFRAPDHGERFVRLLDKAMPGWRTVRARLNRYPLTEWASGGVVNEAA